MNSQSSSEPLHSDYLVIGGGIAGLAYALKMANHGHVTILAKAPLTSTNSSMAQGGIAAVVTSDDSFEGHIRDTLNAGAGLCKTDIVKKVVEQAPQRIEELIAWDVQFDRDLTREGGHHHRRVLHVQDHTGQAIQNKLIERCRENPNIQILEEMCAIDLITDKKVEPNRIGTPRCIGCYALNKKTGRVQTFLARVTTLAAGGAGKVYLYTTNWSGATGDGIAMAHRAGARVSNLEFMQFHPTCLYHPSERSFLISEALRGEGAELINKAGEAFMKKYDPMGALAPRDIVARSIDAEMKRSGAECVYLDISHKDPHFIMSHFPSIHKRCLALGIDITKEPIPVVPAAHYLCGGILVDEWGRTDVEGLFAIGENASTGLHGANRLASNSLLECLSFAHWAHEWVVRNQQSYPLTQLKPQAWTYYGKHDQDEMVVITHMWEEIRRLMWNYVGIVRTNKRLQRAEHRLNNLMAEIQEYYWNFSVHSDILELRNISLVALLTVHCALKRGESRGIHYNLDFPWASPDSRGVDTII